MVARKRLGMKSAGTGGDASGALATGAGGSDDMIETYERVISRMPFRVRRRVRWAECDPAGVVYTGKFAEYLLSAVSLFYENLVAGSYRQFTGQLGVDTPCRGLELDFRGALWPDDEFTMMVSVGEIRRSTFDLLVDAVQDSGRDVFHGRFTPILIPKGGERRSIEIPEAYRAALEPHLTPGSQETAL
jgi:acyl-CoA thioesterase FadM